MLIADRPPGPGRSVKSTDTRGGDPSTVRRRGHNRRGICAAAIAAVCLLSGYLPAHAQATDAERRKLEIEGKQQMKQKQQQRQDQATEKANAARQIQQFQRGEQSRENWINQLEQRNKQQYENINRPH